MVKLCCGLFLVKSGQWVFLEVYVFLTILDAAQHTVVANQMVIFFLFKNSKSNGTDDVLLLCVYIVVYGIVTNFKLGPRYEQCVQSL